MKEIYNKEANEKLVDYNRKESKKMELTLFERVAKEWRSLLLVGIVSALFLLFLKYEKLLLEDFPFLEDFVSAIFSSLLISGFVVIADRLYSKKSISEFIKEQFLESENRISQNMHNIFTTRFQFGLRQIIERVDENEVIARAENRNVMWMNTKFNELEKSIEIIKQSLREGTHVRVLLMHKDNECAYFRARDAYEYVDNDEGISEHTQDYIDGLGTCQSSMLRLYRDWMRERSENPRVGDLEVRFYMDLPAVPIIIVESGERHEVVYTGFYLNKYSSGMPYIEWLSAEGEFVDNVYRYFENKWHFAAEYDASNLVKSESEYASRDQIQVS